MFMSEKISQRYFQISQYNTRPDLLPLILHPFVVESAACLQESIPSRIVEF